MTDFEKARDDAAETRGYRQCSTGQKSLDAAIRWYLEIGFQDGANWAKSFLQSDIDKLQKENEELKLAFQSLQAGFELDKLEKEITSLRESLKLAATVLKKTDGYMFVLCQPNNGELFAEWDDLVREALATIKAKGEL